MDNDWQLLLYNSCTPKYSKVGNHPMTEWLNTRSIWRNFMTRSNNTRRGRKKRQPRLHDKKESEGQQ
jgi:hypothetical protein